MNYCGKMSEENAPENGQRTVKKKKISTRVKWVVKEVYVYKRI